MIKVLFHWKSFEPSLCSALYSRSRVRLRLEKQFQVHSQLGIGLVFLSHSDYNRRVITVNQNRGKEYYIFSLYKVTLHTLEALTWFKWQNWSIFIFQITVLRWADSSHLSNWIWVFVHVLNPSPFNIPYSSSWASIALIQDFVSNLMQVGLGWVEAVQSPLHNLTTCATSSCGNKGGTYNKVFSLQINVLKKSWRWYRKRSL